MSSLPANYDYAKDLRETREALGLRQVEMAEHLGVSSNTLARRERGELGKGLNLIECRLALIGLRQVLGRKGGR
jgi:transcriptional regulator with XRE-family HTH domain